MGIQTTIRRTWTVGCYLGTFRFMRAWDVRPEEASQVVDPFTARAALSAAAASRGAFALSDLGAALDRYRPAHYNVRTHQRELLKELFEAIDSKRLVALKEIPARPPVIIPKEDVPLDFASKGSVKVTATIEFMVVYDQANTGLEGLRFKVKTADGKEQQVTTDGSGKFKLSGLPPGSLDLVTDPAHARLETTVVLRAVADKPTPGWTTDDEPETTAQHLLRVDARRVRAGETFKSVAKDCEVPWKELARFNFGTDDEAQVAKRLPGFLGCHPGKSLDDIVFDDLSEPGILFVPKPFRSSFYTSQTPTLRVAGVPRPRTRFLFSA